jgi:hypothetical protein
MSQTHGTRSKEYQALFLVWGAVCPGHHRAAEVGRAQKQSLSGEEAVKSRTGAGKKDRRKILATIDRLCSAISQPITFRFSRLVGAMLKEIPVDREPVPQFKLYMWPWRALGASNVESTQRPCFFSRATTEKASHSSYYDR